MKKIDELQRIIDESNNIVFFGGAGVSTESGIKDYRSKDGLYNLNYKYPPELILSSNFFYNNTEEFYKFYKDKLNCLNSEPNIIHNYLAKLEQKGKLKGIITQNIDGLHTKAGNKKVYELHGTIYNNHCIKCGKYYDAKYVFNSIGIPKCKCGGIIKPDVTLYGEILDESILNMSIHLISTCDTLIVAGTSLLVEPASSLIKLFKGKNLVILNRSNTKYCDIASLVINDSLGKIFKQLH